LLVLSWLSPLLPFCQSFWVVLVGFVIDHPTSRTSTHHNRSSLDQCTRAGFFIFVILTIGRISRSFGLTEVTSARDDAGEPFDTIDQCAINKGQIYRHNKERWGDDGGKTQILVEYLVHFDDVSVLFVCVAVWVPDAHRNICWHYRFLLCDHFRRGQDLQPKEIVNTVGVRQNRKGRVHLFFLVHNAWILDGGRAERFAGTGCVGFCRVLVYRRK